MLLPKQQQLTANSPAASAGSPSQSARRTATHSTNDPRLKWARPEWIESQHSGGNTVPATPHTANSSRAGAVLKPKHQTLLDRVTYGSYNDIAYESGNSHNDSSSSSSSTNSLQERDQHPQLFQALGIDFGAQRVGIAVRRSNSNVPLLTLHRQQQQNLQSSGSRCAVEPTQQHQQRRHSGVISLKRTAAAILQLALQEGCDGFIVGLPVYNNNQQRHTGAAAARVQQQEERRLNSIIRTFALRLAELAVPLQLAVLLVNEQQSSQQARAVMSGAAAYDIGTVQDQEQQQQQQQEQRQAWKASKINHQQQTSRRGRDAFAAALILSRYYNGLVQPIAHIVPQEQPSSSSIVADSQATASSSTGSSSNSSCCWDLKQQRQAAADLRLMMTPPGEQRRRHKQRECTSATTAVHE